MSSRYSVTFHSGLRPNITRRVDLDAADLRFNYPLVLFEASSEDVDWYLTLPPDLHEAKFVSWETMRVSFLRLSTTYPPSLGNGGRLVQVRRG
jgi:hypothetical protein